MSTVSSKTWAEVTSAPTQSAYVAPKGSAQSELRKQPSIMPFPVLFRILLRLIFQAGGTVFGSSVRSERMGMPLGVPLRRSKSSGGRIGVDLSKTDVDILIPADQYAGFISTLNSIPIIRGEWDVQEVFPDPVSIPEHRNRYGVLLHRGRTVPGELDNDLSSIFQLRTFELTIPGWTHPLKLDVATTSQDAFNEAQDVVMANMFTKSGSGESIRSPLGLDGDVISAAAVSPFQDTIDELHHHREDATTGRSYLYPISSILFPAKHTLCDCCHGHRGAMKANFILKRINRFLKVLRAGITPIHGSKMNTEGKTFIVTTEYGLGLMRDSSLLKKYKEDRCPITQEPFVPDGDDDAEDYSEYHGERPVVLLHTRQLISLDAFIEYVKSKVDSGSHGIVECPATRAYIK